MALYRYVKQPLNQEAIVVSLPSLGLAKIVNFEAITKFLPGVFILVGFFLISLVIYPFFSYGLTLRRWQKQTLAMPVPEIVVAEAKGFVSPVSVKTETKTEPEVISEVDYNLIANWFPSVTTPAVKANKVTHYTLSIPKLKIDKAVVTIGGKKLFDTLIQYPGTALPGEYGNTVIFGHSVLPAFYNPKDYKSIFSLIPKLEKGDRIFIEFDGMEFVYVVETYFEVKPAEIDILEQRFDQQLLSLVTCVPPGTYLRRGILRARLTKI